MHTDHANSIAVVIPTYNEKDNILSLLHAIRQVLPHARILVVDDSSPDGTAQAVRGAMTSDPHLQLRERPERQGLGPAYVDGFQQVLKENADVVVQMDADFSHRPEDLPALVAAVRAGADLAVGSRYIAQGQTRGWGLGRRLTSRLGSRYARLLLDLPVHDVTGGFRCWRGALLAAVLHPEPLLKQFGFQIEMLHRACCRGARIREVPIVFPDRVHGVSKMRPRIAWEALLGVWRLRRTSRSPHGH